MRIVIAKDAALIALDIEDALTEAGHVVVCNTALASEASRALQAQAIDLALLDVHLHDGPRAGKDLARSICEPRHVPSLFISGNRIDAYNWRDCAIGQLIKPFSTDALLAAVEIVEDIIKSRRPRRLKIPRNLNLFQPDAYYRLMPSA